MLRVRQLCCVLQCRHTVLRERKHSELLRLRNLLCDHHGPLLALVNRQWRGLLVGESIAPCRSIRKLELFVFVGRELVQRAELWCFSCSSRNGAKQTESISP